MLRKQKSIAIFIIKVKYITLFICAKEDLWIIQVLRDTNYIKYLKNLLNRINIVKNIAHKFASSMQVIKDNQATLALV